VDHTTFISTPNVKMFNDLANDLLENPNLTSSIGLVKGTAGRGKTAAAKHYISTNRDSVYVLYVDGYSHSMLARQIAYELTGIKSHTFEKNLELIREATRMLRRMVIIDEADKMPGRLIEMLRGMNERCALPLLLVGEEMLYSRMSEEPRRLSRVRKPIVNFGKVSKVDIALFYEQAIGISITKNIEVCDELLLRSRGDFRLVVSDAMAICKVLNSSGIGAVIMGVIDKL